MVSQDYEDLFKILNVYKVKYLVVGAHAVTFYSEPRFTKDLDIWIPRALNDVKRVFGTLKAFGVPLRNLTPENFNDPTMILQIGVAPVRVDIMMNVPGVSIERAWKNRTRARYGKTPIHILGLSELIQAKKAAGRPQDKLDLAKLVKVTSRNVKKRSR